MSVKPGTTQASHATAAFEEIITLTINPDEGMRLKEGSLKYIEIYSDGTEEHAISGTTFTMPSVNVIITAEFEPITESIYYVDINITNTTGGCVSFAFNSPDNCVLAAAIYDDMGKMIDIKVSEIIEGNNSINLLLSEVIHGSYLKAFVLDKTDYYLLASNVSNIIKS